MSKAKDSIAHGIADSLSDLIEKVSSPASRSGSVVERVGRMVEEDVDLDVIALQMTKNSPNSQKYTRNDVEAYSRLYKDSKTKVTITAKQSRALINDQLKTNSVNNDVSFQLLV
ncbi:hypothetical protein [Hydrogenovibrio sp. JE_KL2]|uniref:hypothetical protein n=1 Tax=Hydrogenovibrio sp. JE_KL2 TaxID=2651188 RepID=UPI00128E2091|nr:hypothetical protein [Hydrogenovibrio sp. JE_KL2]MPQ75776.1 hypothetical protein [Hydrogenovibrio sp. JE_KL2]